MKTNKRFLLAAIFGLALAFTLNACSSDGDDDKWNSYINSDGTGGNDNFDVSSQVYERNGGEYKNNGKIQFRMCDHSIMTDLVCIATSKFYYANAGSVTDGIVNLDLPNKISDKYLSIFEEEGCNVSPKNIQYYSPKSLSSLGFIITNDEESRIGLNLRYYPWLDEPTEGIDYIYFSKAGKITCNYEYEFEGTNFKIIKNINAKAGWNKIYLRGGEESTNNILTNETELKWFLNSI